MGKLRQLLFSHIGIYLGKLLRNRSIERIVNILEEFHTQIHRNL